MCILPKFQRKGFGNYFVSKVFKSDAQLNGRVYTVIRLIHDYILSSYEEPESTLLDLVLYYQIVKVNTDVKDGKLRLTTFREYTKKNKDFTFGKNIH